MMFFLKPIFDCPSGDPTAGAFPVTYDTEEERRARAKRKEYKIQKQGKTVVAKPDFSGFAKREQQRTIQKRRKAVLALALRFMMED